MKMFEEYEVKIKIRENFNGMEINPNLIPLQGKVIKVQCLWQFDADEKYPLEFVLDPLERIDGLSWVSSGDVEILRRLK